MALNLFLTAHAIGRIILVSFLAALKRSQGRLRFRRAEPNPPFAAWSSVGRVCGLRLSRKSRIFDRINFRLLYYSAIFCFNLYELCGDFT